MISNEQKAEMYHSMLIRHDRLDSQIADIKSEAAGMELNETQKARLTLLEQQKNELVQQAMTLLK